MTRREQIIEILTTQEMTSQELCQHFQTTKRTILSDLTHIRKSLKNKNQSLIVKMPLCRQCGFLFKLKAVKEPSKCPKCNSTWIEPPTYKVIPCV